MRSAVMAFTVTEVPVHLEPVTADPFIEALERGETPAQSGPLRHGPVIAQVVPSPACSAGLPVESP
jgi:hypothetical protein